MADKSKIEWTDATWNPVRGCSVVSKGCRNCYAMQVTARFSQRYWEVWQGATLICSAKQKLTEAEARNKVANEAAHGVVMEARPSSEGQAYEGLAYRNSSGAHWTGKVALIEKHLEDPLRWQRPRRIFVNSLSDLFHESIPDEWIDRIFAVMALGDWHTYQVLTKRPQRMRDYLSNPNCQLNVWNAAFAFAAQYPRLKELANRHRVVRNGMDARWPLPGVWLGVSVEDQKAADERIPLLLQTPAAVRWLSVEPLLGPIDIKHPGVRSILNTQHGIHWVVVGGESGTGARPMHPDWARSIRDQCVAAGVPFFFKQWGEWDGGGVFGSGCDDPCGRCVIALRKWDGTRWTGAGLSITGTDWEPGNHLTGGLQIHRVGKKRAGRLLDGREWNEYPNLAASLAA
jgi:protein gp37